MNQWHDEADSQEEYFVDEVPHTERSALLPDLEMPFWLKASLLLLVLVLLLVMTWWSAMNPFSSERERTFAPLASSTTATESAPPFSQTRTRVVPREEPTRYYSNAINYSFLLPSGWKEVAVPNEELPLGVHDVSFTLSNETENCVIAAAQFDRSEADYVQTSFGGRVFSEVSQYDGNWFTNQAFHEEKIEFSDHERQYLEHELRHTYNLDVTDLLLFERNGARVPARCDDDFVSFLQSTEHHYLEKQLESYEQGTISTRMLRNRTGPRASKLVFTNEGNANTYVLADFPVSGYVSRLFLRDSTLYFFGSGGGRRAEANSLYSYDIESNDWRQISSAHTAVNPIITSIYVTSDALYYLSGPTSSRACVDGPGYDCTQQLYRLSLSDNSTTLLASSTPATHIIGYVEDQETLYMQSGYGDAGCVGTRIYVYAASATYETARLSGCVGEPGYAEYQREMSGLAERINERSAKAIRHAFGAYTPADVEPEWLSSTFIFVPAE